MSKEDEQGVITFSLCFNNLLIERVFLLMTMLHCQEKLSPSNSLDVSKCGVLVEGDDSRQDA